MILRAREAIIGAATRPTVPFQLRTVHPGQALRRIATSLRPTRRRVSYLAFFLVVILTLSALAPESAHANWLSDAAAGAVKKIFGVKGNWLSGTLVEWVIQIKSPGLTSDGAGAGLYMATRNFAFAGLGAILTISVLHYWASGLFSQGGGAGVALEGLLRTIGAALFILIWPFVIDSAVALSALMRDELIPGAKLDLINSIIIGRAFFAGLIVGIIVVSIYVLFALALYATKVMLTVGLLTLAGMMPLALGMWAIPALAWFANAMLKACAAIVAVQVAWAGEVYLYASIPRDWLTFHGNGHVLSKIGAPITMIALLFLMLMTATWVLRLGGMSGGNTLSFLTSQLAFGGVNRGIAGAQNAWKPELDAKGNALPKTGKLGRALNPLREHVARKEAPRLRQELAALGNATADALQRANRANHKAANSLGSDRKFNNALGRALKQEVANQKATAWDAHEAQREAASSAAASEGQGAYVAWAGDNSPLQYRAVPAELQQEVSRVAWSGHNAPQQLYAAMAQRGGLEEGHQKALLALSKFSDDQLDSIPRPEVHAQAPPTAGR